VQATARGGQVAAFLFGYPLRPGDPRDRANKILWVVRTPRDGSELLIHGHPLGTTTPVIDLRQPADSSPGEIYPSIVNVPEPACWQTRQTPAAQNTPPRQLTGEPVTLETR
jgi:hypothetical protein